MLALQLPSRFCLSFPKGICFSIANHERLGSASHSELKLQQSFSVKPQIV